MQYQYKTVPFIGDSKHVLNAKLIAQQLTEIINANSHDGWVFDQINNVNIAVSQGCLASAFGLKDYEKRFDMLIFRKAIMGNNSNDKNSSQPTLNPKELSPFNGLNISKSESQINSFPIHQESYTDLNDAINMLESEGFKIVKILDISSVLSGKDYRMSKGRKIQDCSGDEIIKYANGYMQNQLK